MSDYSQRLSCSDYDRDAQDVRELSYPELIALVEGIVDEARTVGWLGPICAPEAEEGCLWAFLRGVLEDRYPAAPAPSGPLFDADELTSGWALTEGVSNVDTDFTKAQREGAK